ncbi:MAG TPA: ABC transporter ATP-binding protein [Acidimicrobiia bacterium]|nr:ABC transporter ATP-binding protein [Acidimicrobiia bacterium]
MSTGTTPAPGLEIRDITVRFGGNTAVDGVSLSAPPGRITGLIGPNGAGKTTIFNTCSGLLQPNAGTVNLFGRDVTGVRPAARARRGLGRTFQRLELCDSMSVADNVALGVESGLAGDRPLRHLASTARQRRQIASAVADALALCGLDGDRNRTVGLLSTGRRRLVELARVVAGGYPLLLLDEPSSGLDTAETDGFGRILRQIVARGTGILLVEHDMVLVMDICDYLYVVDFGTLIFEGTPAETQASDIVRAAYLGADQEGS